LASGVNLAKQRRQEERMAERGVSAGKLALLVAAIAAIIVYGSLYPFVFAAHGTLGDALATLLGTRDLPPKDRGDLIANVLLYIPFGLFLVLALPERWGRSRRALATILAGTLLSAAMEVAQFWDRGRVTNFSDLYLNAIGTAAGAAIAALVGRSFRLPFLARRQQAFPLLLIAAWLGYRLYPYAPSLDPAKYLHSVATALSPPPLFWLRLLEQVATWLTLAPLVLALVGRRRSADAIGLLYLAMLLLEMLIVDQVITLDEVMGGAFAALLWILVLAPRPTLRRLVPPALLGLYIILESLYPYALRGTPRPFGWIPFLGLMRSSLEIAIRVFCFKSLLYGGMVWLLVQAGTRLRDAALATAGLVLGLSLAQTLLASRSAEITDAIMVLGLAAVMKLTAPRPALPPRSAPDPLG
jgi:glycopeptide antibiotics resistance protein